MSSLKRDNESQEINKTAERIIPEQFESKLEYLLYLRHLFAYEFARNIIPENNNLLEIGCGEGYGAAYLANNMNLSITAIDIDKDCIRHAQNKYSQEYCKYRHYDGHKVPYQESTFDAAICFHVIEHIDNDHEFIREIHRVLKPNGILVIITPNRTYRLKPGQKPWNPYHVREYYPEEFTHLLKRSFAHVRTMGVVGNEEIQLLEINRVKPNSKGPKRFFRIMVRTLNRVILIFMPELLKKFLKKLLKKESITQEKDMQFLSEYSIADYSVVKDRLNKTLDILCVCKK